MSGKAARSSAVETRRRGDRNVLCPRDTGTGLAQPPDEIDILVFFEIAESSDVPVHIGADTEVGTVDVTVSTIGMCVYIRSYRSRTECGWPSQSAMRTVPATTSAVRAYSNWRAIQVGGPTTESASVVANHAEAPPKSEPNAEKPVARERPTF